MIFEGFNGVVFDWYDCYGCKDLFWQQGIIFYWVWVLEIMLQQIQVSIVFGYFDCFMVVLFDVEVLVVVVEDEVLYLWIGFGYYSCVCNLYKIVQIVVEWYVGEFFCDVE